LAPHPSFFPTCSRVLLEEYAFFLATVFGHSDAFSSRSPLMLFSYSPRNSDRARCPGSKIFPPNWTQIGPPSTNGRGFLDPPVLPPALLPGSGNDDRDISNQCYYETPLVFSSRSIPGSGGAAQPFSSPTTLSRESCLNLSPELGAG